MSDDALAWSYAHWTPDQERAYQTYRGMARRSLRKTAEETGIPLGTLMTWCRQLGWVLRVRDDDVNDGRIMRDHALMALHNDLDNVIDRVRHIALHSQDERMALDAAKWIAGTVGIAPSSGTAGTALPRDPLARAPTHALSADTSTLTTEQRVERMRQRRAQRRRTP